MGAFPSSYNSYNRSKEESINCYQWTFRCIFCTINAMNKFLIINLFFLLLILPGSGSETNTYGSGLTTLLLLIRVTWALRWYRYAAGALPRRVSGSETNESWFGSFFLGGQERWGEHSAGRHAAGALPQRRHQGGLPRVPGECCPTLLHTLPNQGEIS